MGDAQALLPWPGGHFQGPAVTLRVGDDGTCTIEQVRGWQREVARGMGRRRRAAAPTRCG